MKEGPNIATIGALIGDPARANILTALMSGQALTATELALLCGVTAQTVSSHLAKLQSGGLLRQRKQGRHRYFALSGDDVGEMLEGIMGLAASRGHLRVRTGPKDPALRKARVCYNHLAGDYGVRMWNALRAAGFIQTPGTDGTDAGVVDAGVVDASIVDAGITDASIDLSDAGRAFVLDFGIDLPALEKKRRPLCKSCLDWSARKSHLAGSLGTALLDRFFELKWASREDGTRVVQFTPSGEREFETLFPQ